MNVDPAGKSFLFFLIFSIIIGAVVGGAVNGYKAYKEGADGWGIFGAILGGMILGGAMGAAMVLGGAAGLTSLGVAVTGFGLSTAAALGVSVAIGIGAGLASYSVETLMRNDREWNWGDFALSGVMGGAQAAATFGLAFVGGRSGLFTNKLTTMSSSKFLIYVFNTTGKITTAQAFVYSAQILLNNGLARLLLTSVPAALVRMGIEKLIRG